MKKTLLFALVLGLAVMFAVPAFAFKIESGKDNSFYFGAIAYTDLGVWNRSKELVPGGKSDRTELILDVPRHSRIRGNLDVGNVGAYFELRMGGDQQQASGGYGANANFSSSGFYFGESAKIYGYYKFGNCTLLAGKTDGHFMSVTPNQSLGYDNNNHIAGFGWGAIYDQRNAQVRFSQDVSKAFGYDISLVQPQYYTDTGSPLVTTGAQQSLGTFPLTALKLRMNFGAVSMMPAGFVQYVKWNDLPQVGPYSPTDNMTAWGLVLPIVVKAGAFTGTFQASYGINEGATASSLAAGNQTVGGPMGFQSLFQGYRRAANGDIKNTTGYQGFFDLAFTSGAVTPHFYLGYDRAENDLFVGSDKNNVRMMYGVNLNWKIADSFYVVPEFTYYDHGKDPTKVNNPDIGKEWQAGVQFQFIF